ncbi:MAG TPA: hypothetical protein VET48_02770 [Steroidobacteraceae bacterium]|nr:hypothetical protein [Steroidobacteraceae bacterium]
MRQRATYLFAIVSLAAMSAHAAGSHGPIPRTSWGTPDLQGTWTNASVTSLERDDAFKGKASMTLAEAAAFEKNTAWAKLAEADAKPSDPKSKATANSDPGGYNAFWLDPGTKLAVVNGEARTSFIVDPSNGKIPYTPAGLKAFAAVTASRNFDGPEARALGERCLLAFGSTSGPPMLPDVYNNNYQIVQTPDTVVVLVEMVHDARIIRIGGKHLPKNITPWLGDSIGHWEGDTLVVETTNLNPGQRAHYGIKQRYYLPPTGKVTERFTRTGENEILYQFTVEDSEAYTQPWKGEEPLRATKDHIYEYACHEGNYALPGILAGARQAEKATKNTN